MPRIPFGTNVSCISSANRLDYMEYIPDVENKLLNRPAEQYMRLNSKRLKYACLNFSF